MVTSTDRSVCQEAYDRIGHDYDEDYKIMSDQEFLDMVVRIFK